MSTWRVLEQPCPRCGTSMRLRVAVSVHIGRAPAVREAVMRGELHRFPCTACGAVTIAEVAFEYLDFDRKQLFLVFPTHDEPRWPELELVPAGVYERNFTAPDLPAMVHDLGRGFRVRAVFGIGQLREKLMLAEAGVDDAIAEAWKLAWMRAVPFARLFPDSRPRLLGEVGDRLRFIARPRGGEPVEIDALRADLLAPRPDDATVSALGAGPYVDVGRFVL